MLYIDKYSVNGVDDVLYNHQAYKLINDIAHIDNIPHLMIVSALGSGSKSFINYYIKIKYNLPRVKTLLNVIKIKCANKEIDFSFLHSDYHYLIDPFKYGVYDKQIIQFLLNDILKYKPINNAKYHIIVINNADRLTTEAQQSLRRTLEKFMHNCRFIFLVNNHSAMLEPIKSRCLTIRLDMPTIEESVKLLQKICTGENINATKPVLEFIVNFNKNIKTSINSLQIMETYKIDLTSVEKTRDHILSNDNCYIIVNLLIRNANLDIDMSDLITELRTLLHSMLTECTDAISIVKGIFYHMYDYLTAKNNETMCIELIKYINDAINGIKICNKPIYHIEFLCLQLYALLC